MNLLVGQAIPVICRITPINSVVKDPTPLHTYIHNWPLQQKDYYNPSARIIDQLSHTTYVVCINFIRKWRDLQFKVDSERQIF